MIVIDEAQTIPEDDTFEELRLLLNFQLNDNFLLTLVLLGQAELKEKINNLPQLRQRIAVLYHLKSLSQDETREYVRHRLEVADVRYEIFLEDALAEIYKYSGGVPRRINNICDMALLVGCSEEASKIDKTIIMDVISDMEIAPVGIDDKTGVTADG